MQLGDMDHGPKKHILLLPMMAQGHLKPFLQLATQIKTRCPSLTLTILTTPCNVQFLREMSSSNLSCNVVRYVALPFQSSDHGLPEGVENTNGLALKDMIKLLQASTALETPVRRFIAEEMVEKDGFPPICVIYDWFLGWGVNVARDFGSLSIVFSTAGAYGTAAYLSIWKDLPHLSCDNAREFNIPEFPKTHRFELSQLSPIARVSDGTDEWSKFFGAQASMSMASNGWLCNTVEEFEPLGLSVLRNYLKVPVWAVGSTISTYQEDDLQQDSTLRWLDLQDEGSVVYISFGSQNTITSAQMMELACGLEESGKRFVWVIRPPLGVGVGGCLRLSEWLPNGFLERVVEKRGILVHKSAPQTKILAHRSIGAFLSHCGWNSVLEAISHGVPIIGWPLAAEQAFNSKMLEEEVGVAMEMARGLEAKITKEDVKRALDMALDRCDGEGGRLKRKATEMAVKLRLATKRGVNTGSTLRAIDGFLHTLLH